MVRVSISTFQGTPETAVRRIAAAGFHYAELGESQGDQLLNRGEKAWRNFRVFAESMGVSFCQGHLPLSRYICVADEAKRRENIALHRAFCKMYHALGIPAAVLHTGNNLIYKNGEPKEIIRKRQTDSLRDLLSDLPEGMTICLENTPPESFEDVEEIIEALDNHPNLGFCLDTGHLNLSMKPDFVNYILRAGKRLKALHLQDNSGPAFTGDPKQAEWEPSDRHMFPGFFKGSIDWMKLVLALRQIGYEGLWNLEVAADLTDRRVPGDTYRDFILKQNYERAEMLFNYDPDAPRTSDPVNDMKAFHEVAGDGLKVYPEGWHVKAVSKNYTLEIDPVRAGHICSWSSFGQDMLFPVAGSGWAIPAVWWPKATACNIQQGLKIESLKNTGKEIELRESCIIDDGCYHLTGCTMNFTHSFTENSFSASVQLCNTTAGMAGIFAFRFLNLPRFMGCPQVPAGKIFLKDGTAVVRDGSVLYFRIGKAYPEIEQDKVTEISEAEMTLETGDGTGRLHVSYPKEQPCAVCFWEMRANETTFEPIFAPRTLAPGETCEFGMKVTF